MYSEFGGFGTYFRKKRTYIDNTTFKLHYRVTFGILILCSLLVTLSQFFGSPIQCIVEGVPGGIMNTFCWIHGTFTIPSQLAGKVGNEVAHPGVAPLRNQIYDKEKGHVKWTEEGDEVRHAWYQWVCFVLCLQALLCYVPHYLWKSWEGGKLSMLIQGLDGPMLKGSEEFADRRKSIVTYFLRTNKTHNLYALKYVFCEFLNIVNILFQIWLMDFFFGGQFTAYGTKVLSETEKEIEDRVDPMNRVFPKVTKCTFHEYGPSGTIQNKDGLCILAMNIINEKIYVFLWFWYIFITVWTAIHLMVRFLSLVSSYCRYLLFCNRVRAVNRNDVSVVLKKCQYGDWFLLMQMSKHINPAVFYDVVLDLRDSMDKKRADNND